MILFEPMMYQITKYHSKLKFLPHFLLRFSTKAEITESAIQSIFLSDRMIPAGIQTGPTGASANHVDHKTSIKFIFSLGEHPFL